APGPARDGGRPGYARCGTDPLPCHSAGTAEALQPCTAGQDQRASRRACLRWPRARVCDWITFARVFANWRPAVFCNTFALRAAMLDSSNPARGGVVSHVIRTFLI